MTAYTPAQVARIKQGYRRDEPVASIAAAIGRSPASVKVKAHALRKAGLLPMTNRNRRWARSWNHDQVARVIAGVVRGEVRAMIAGDIGRSRRAVYHRIAELREAGAIGEEAA